MVMPMCWGTVIGYRDEYDLTSCNCSPSDPIVARLELAERNGALILHLRDLRRYRQVQKNTVKRILSIATTMQYSGDRVGLQRAVRDIRGLAMELTAELRALPKSVKEQ